MIAVLRYVFVCALMAFGSTASAQVDFRAVADEWAPFGGVNLHNGGMSLDVISAVLERAGYTSSTEIVPFERALSGARHGDYDIVGNLFYDPEFAETMILSDPFYETDILFLRRTGSDATFTDIPSLGNQSIAIGAGYAYSPEFDTAEDLNTVTVTTVLQGVRMVAAGRTDLTLDSEDVLRYIVAVESPDLMGQVEILPTVLATNHVRMGLRRDFENAEAIMQTINATLAEMRQDGSLDALLAMHQY